MVNLMGTKLYDKRNKGRPIIRGILRRLGNSKGYHLAIFDKIALNVKYEHVFESLESNPFRRGMLPQILTYPNSKTAKDSCNLLLRVHN